MSVTTRGVADYRTASKRGVAVCLSLTLEQWLVAGATLLLALATAGMALYTQSAAEATSDAVKEDRRVSVADIESAPVTGCWQGGGC